MITWYKNNANVLRIDGARNTITGKLITGATVSATIVEKNTVNFVAGIPQPLLLTAVSGRRGNYAATVAESAQIEIGTVYTARVTFSGAGGEFAYVEEDIEVVAREE